MLIFAARVRHLATTAKVTDFEHLHDEVGYNYRMTSTAAALGIAQLERLNEFFRKKRVIEQRYSSLLRPYRGVELHPEPMHCNSIFWMYSVCVAQTGTRWLHLSRSRE